MLSKGNEKFTKLSEGENQQWTRQTLKPEDGHMTLVRFLDLYDVLAVKWVFFNKLYVYSSVQFTEVLIDSTESPISPFICSLFIVSSVINILHMCDTFIPIDGAIVRHYYYYLKSIVNIKFCFLCCTVLYVLTHVQGQVLTIIISCVQNSSTIL